MSNFYLIMNNKLIIIGVTCILSGSIFYTMDSSRKAKNHPTRKLAEAALKLDKRISNYCGKNYKIKKYEWLGEDNNTVKYRMRLEGIRGKCKVLVKCDKHTHYDLKNHSEEQTKYSKQSRELKSQSAFIPYNFNDILIPTKATLNRMMFLLNSKNLSEDILEFNREKFLNGDYQATKEEPINSLNEKISDNDTFYRISSLVMVANDNLVFNIRPIGPKYRSYDIEDTFYSNTTYNEVLFKMMQMQFDYNEAMSSDLSTEEFRNEIILQKQTRYQDQLRKRKNIVIFNGLLILTGLMLVRFLSKNKIDVVAFKQIQNYVDNNQNLKYLGKTKRVLCISYNYNYWNRMYSIYGMIIGDKAQMVPFSTFVKDVEKNTLGPITIKPELYKV